MALPPAAGVPRRRRAPARRRAGAPAARRRGRGRHPGRPARPRPRRARRLGARTASCEEALRRARFALGVDDDLREFCARFRDDPLIGRSVRARPHLRVRRRPEPVRGARLGGLRAAHRVRARGRDRAPDRPRARAAGARGPGCATCPPRRPGRGGAGRARGLRPVPRPRAGAATAAREVAAGPRSTSAPPTTRRPGARLRAIPGIGAWTVEMLAPPRARAATTSSPAGDLAYMKLVGRAADRRPAGEGDRGGGPRALRALRALGGPGRRPRARRGRAQAPGEALLRLEPLARQELVVSALAVAGGRLTSPWSCIQRPNAAHGPEVHASPRAGAVGGEEDGQRRAGPRRAGARGPGRGWPSRAGRPRPRDRGAAAWASARASRKRRMRAPPSCSASPRATSTSSL